MPGQGSSDLLPGVAVVVGAVQATLAELGLDERPRPASLGRGQGHADLAERAVGQALVAADVGPGVAAVVRAPDTAVGAAGVDRPEVASGLPGRGEAGCEGCAGRG